MVFLLLKNTEYGTYPPHPQMGVSAKSPYSVDYNRIGCSVGEYMARRKDKKGDGGNKIKSLRPLLVHFERDDETG
jgi:hypothetical protein